MPCSLLRLSSRKNIWSVISIYDLLPVSSVCNQNEWRVTSMHGLSSICVSYLQCRRYVTNMYRLSSVYILSTAPRATRGVEIGGCFALVAGG